MLNFLFTIFIGACTCFLVIGQIKADFGKTEGIWKIFDYEYRGE